MYTALAPACERKHTKTPRQIVGNLLSPKGAEQFLHEREVGATSPSSPGSEGAGREAENSRCCQPAATAPASCSAAAQPLARLVQGLPGSNMDIKYKSQSTTVPAVSISRTVTDKNKTHSEKKLVKY